jgi:hypothetical protein
VTHALADALTRAEQHVHELQGNNGFVCPWLQPLKAWSLRQSRVDSLCSVVGLGPLAHFVGRWIPNTSLLLPATPAFGSLILRLVNDGFQSDCAIVARPQTEHSGGPMSEEQGVKRIKLKLDDLQVESFETLPSQVAGGGTVQAYETGELTCGGHTVCGHTCVLLCGSNETCTECASTIYVC